MKKLFPLKKAIVLFAAILSGMASVHAATITVSADAVVAGSNYNTIKDAYAYIVTLGALTEPYVIELQNTYDPTSVDETYPITFTVSGATATNNITIRPAAGVSKVISNPLATVKSTTTSATSQKISVASTTGMSVGMMIGGVGVTNGITITAINGNDLTLNAPITSSVASVLRVGTTAGSSQLSAASTVGATTITLATATSITAAPTGGDAVYGNGVPAGTTVTAYNSSTKVVTLSAALTAASTANNQRFTFGNLTADPTAVVNTLSFASVSGITAGMTVYGIGQNLSVAYPTVASVDAGANAITITGTGQTIPNAANVFFGTANTKTIVFNGASYVTIDGGGLNDKRLIIQNPNNIAAQTVNFQGNATNNVIRNCYIKGANISGDAYNDGKCGQIYFANGATNKSNFNTIEYNDICDIDGNVMPICMFNFGHQSDNATTYNTVQNNNIYNCSISANYSANGNVAVFNYPSSVGAANVWVLNNRIFWTKTLDATPASSIGAYFVFGFGGSAAGSYNRIEGNTIGGTAANNSGIAEFTINGVNTNSFTVMNLNLNTTVKGNVIKNIKVTNNSTGPCLGINIRANATAITDADNVCYGNTVKDITVNSTSSNATFVGITIASAAAHPARNISNNEVSGITQTCSVAGTQNIIRGVQITGTASTILWNFSGNKIYNLTAGNSSSTSANTIIGLDVIANAATVDKNLIYSLKPVTASATRTGVLYGLRNTTGNTTGTIVKNNVVCLGNDITNDLATFYAVDQAGTLPANTVVKYYNNSVYVGGNSGDNSTGKSYAFYSAAAGTTATTYDIKNNIFVNQRVNGATPTATAKHYAFGFATAGVVKSCDNNLYYATPLGLTSTPSDKADLAAWQGALVTGSDAASKEGNPGFVDATATTPDLHIASPSSLANQSGVLLADVSDDFSGLIRADYTPNDMGAYVITGSTAVKSTVETSALVYATEKAILFNNLEGQIAKVFSISGQLVKSVLLTSDKVSLPADKGFYLVNAGSINTKVLVK